MKRLEEMGVREKGRLGEKLAAAYLMRRGWDVFINISNLGLVDLIALKGRYKILKIEVKFGANHSLTEEQKLHGIILMQMNSKDEAIFYNTGAKTSAEFIDWLGKERFRRDVPTWMKSLHKSLWYLND